MDYKTIARHEYEQQEVVNGVISELHRKTEESYLDVFENFAIFLLKYALTPEYIQGSDPEILPLSRLSPDAYALRSVVFGPVFAFTPHTVERAYLFARITHHLVETVIGKAFAAHTRWQIMHPPT